MSAPRTLEEAFQKALAGEVRVDERLCASRPVSTPSHGIPEDSPLAPALQAVENGLDGDDSVLVTPPYRIVRESPAKKRKVRRRKPTCEEEPREVDTHTHETMPLLDDESHVSPRQLRREAFKGLPNGDLDLDK